MDEILKLLLANKNLTVRFDTFISTGSMRIKFMHDGLESEQFFKLIDLRADEGPDIIVEVARMLAVKWKLKGL